MTFAPLNFFYWLYLWQLKEYRFDRLYAELRTWPARLFVRRWLIGAYRYPKMTLKLLLVAGFSALLLLILYAVIVAGAGIWGIAGGLILVYLLAPLSVVAGVGLLVVPSVLVKRVLAALAARKRGQFRQLIVIGVAGSYGKTTSKEFIAQLLAQKFKVLRTPGSVNTEIGIARQILKELTAKTQVYVVEMGAYRRGEIKRICQIVKPRIGVLTGLNEQHLALFGSFKNLQAAKLELAASLPEHGVLFYNAADWRVNEAVEALGSCTSVRKIAYTDLTYPKLPERFRNLDFLTTNLAAAVGVARFLGLSTEQIRKGTAGLRLPARTMRISLSKNKATIIDDTYSTNPDGFLSALKVLRNYPGKTKIVVTPGIIELGHSSDRVYQRIKAELANGADLVIVTDASLRAVFPLATFAATSRQISDTIQNFHQGRIRELVILLEGRLRPDVFVALKNI